jgi:hypothetical protein
MLFAWATLFTGRARRCWGGDLAVVVLTFRGPSATSAFLSTLALLVLLFLPPFLAPFSITSGPTLVRLELL